MGHGRSWSGTTCALLSERGLEAPSPTTIVKRSGVGQGSLYHHFEGKNDVALAAIRHMCSRTLAILQREPDADPVVSVNELTDESTDVEAALDSLFARREGSALLRLLTDPAVAESEKKLWREVQGWCYELRAWVYVALGGDASHTFSAKATTAGKSIGFRRPVIQS